MLRETIIRLLVCYDSMKHGYFENSFIFVLVLVTYQVLVLCMVLLILFSS